MRKPLKSIREITMRVRTVFFILFLFINTTLKSEEMLVGRKKNYFSTIKIDVMLYVAQNLSFRRQRDLSSLSDLM